MTLFLLLVAFIIIACIALNKLSNKLGIPMLLAFILLGMTFGSDGLFRIQFDNYEFAEQICSIALIFIMFYGGFGTSWKAAKPVAAKSIILSTIGVFFTAGLTCVFCHYFLNIDWLESLLLGSVISSTDAASVFSILRSKRLNLKYNTASLLEIESGSNDPCSYMLTIITIAIMNNTANSGQIAYMFFSQIVFGLIFGVLIAILTIILMKHLNFEAGFDTIFVIAIALFAYAAPTELGGNGYLSVYIVGIILGNSNLKAKKNLVHFFDTITGLMQMLVFFLLGLLSFPSKLPSVFLQALAISVFLTFVGRPIVVSLLLAPFKSNISQIIVTSWAGLRGAASIVFAIIATLSVDTSNDIFHTIFCIVLFSILLQGSLLPYISKTCGMIDDTGDVMKTFTDYTDEVPVQFIQSRITSNHPWCNNRLNSVLMPPDTIIALVVRDGKKLTPNGDSKLKDGDNVIICAPSSAKIEGVSLSEKIIANDDTYIGMTLSEIDIPKNELIIMIQRANEVIIPTGNTVIEANDILVINNT